MRSVLRILALALLAALPSCFEPQDGEPPCEAQDLQTRRCGTCGTMTRTCLDHRWGTWGPCSEPPTCGTEVLDAGRGDVSAAPDARVESADAAAALDAQHGVDAAVQAQPDAAIAPDAALPPDADAPDADAAAGPDASRPDAGPVVIDEANGCVYGYAFGNPDPDPNAIEATRWKTFTAPVDGRLTSASVKVRTVRGSSQGDLALILSTPAASGCPGTVLQTTTIPKVQVSAAFTEVVAAFDAEVRAGTRYTLELTQSSMISSSCYEWCAVGGAPAGQLFGKTSTTGTCVAENVSPWLRLTFTPD